MHPKSAAPAKRMEASTVSTATIAAGLRLAIRNYPDHLWMDRHSHGEWRFCLPVQGAYTDSWGSEFRTRTPGALSLHPPDEVHTTRFHAASICFHVTFAEQWIDRLRIEAGAKDAPHEFLGGPAPSLGRRMYEEFRRSEFCSGLILEGMAMELMGWSGRASLAAKGPAWLYAARDLLHDRFSEILQMKEIADAVGVQPVHLARQFRKEFGCSLGEYIRHLRIAFVRDGLTRDIALADLAAQAGFADQSHMTRIFKRVTGETPAQQRTRR